jgi:hypothetical protein
VLVDGEGALDGAIAHRAARVGEEDAAGRHGRAGIAGMNGCAPADLQPAGREGIEDAGLVPDTGAPGAAPLRPVISLHLRDQDRTKKHDSYDAMTHGHLESTRFYARSRH